MKEKKECPQCEGKLIKATKPTHNGERKAVVCEKCGYEVSDAARESDKQ